MAAVVVATTGSRIPRAVAQEAEAADPAVVAAARALAIEGVKLAQDDKCDQAIPKLERAEQLHHGPIVLSQLGECYVQTGRLVEGAEAMRSVLRTPQPDNATDAMKRAYTVARSTLDSTKGKIAMLTITVEPSTGIDPRVTVDGKDVPDALLGAARPTDPGERQLEASAPGYLATRRKVELEPGEEQTVALSLVIDPAALRAKAPDAAEAGERASAAKAEVPEPAVQASASVEPTAASRSRLPAYIAWGVGIAGVGAGIGFGWVAKDQEAVLDKACPNDVCPRTHRAKLDAARTNGVISTVSLSVGLGAAALGTVLYFLSGADGDSATDAEASLRPGGADLTLRF